MVIAQLSPVPAAQVLIIHLKRFSFSKYRRNKLDNEVTFPLTGLDLAAHVLQEQVTPS